jgi:DNA ligase 1
MLTFAALAAQLQRIEQTSSRRQLIDLMSDLFGQADADDVAILTYLLQGRVAPFYEPVEFGLGEKSVMASLATAYGVERAEVQALYGRLGDLGRVAERLAGQHPPPDAAHPPGVAEVFEDLRRIAGLSGSQSVAKKAEAFVSLLRRLDPAGAKHLVRIPLGTSRLGVGDATILAALAQARLGSDKLRPPLEEAYNRTSDLGLIGNTLWQGGLEAVRALPVQVGRPIRPELAERLPSAQAILDRFGGRAHVQRKFDGIRVQIHLDRDQPAERQVRLFSRNLEDLTHAFPEIVQGTLDQVRARSAILDSEALAYNPLTEEFLPFQETTRRRRKHDITATQADLPLKAMVFDVMYRDGRPLLDRPLVERLAALRDMVQGEAVLPGSQAVPGDRLGTLQAVLGEMITDADRLQLVFEESLSHGLEGLVAKRVDSTYQAGARNFNWVKLKKHSGGALQDTVDTVLLGYFLGRGKRSELGVGALLVGVYDAANDTFVTVSKVGTGLSDAQWAELRARADGLRVPSQPARVRATLVPSVWIEPALVVEVLADEITRSPAHTAGYALRFPRFVRLRESDKRPEDATTLKEIEELYQQQFARPA